MEEEMRELVKTINWLLVNQYWVLTFLGVLIALKIIHIGTAWYLIVKIDRAVDRLDDASEWIVMAHSWQETAANQGKDVRRILQVVEKKTEELKVASTQTVEKGKDIEKQVEVLPKRVVDEMHHQSESGTFPQPILPPLPDPGPTS